TGQGHREPVSWAASGTGDAGEVALAVPARWGAGHHEATPLEPWATAIRPWGARCTARVCEHLFPSDG
ncbi:hypothetical protein E2562_030483, partial [Oryza meyeriana var. granulata]